MTQVVRKNLMVEEKKLRALKHALGAASESDAVRQAVDRVLAGEKIIAAFGRLRRRGTWGTSRTSATR